MKILGCKCTHEYQDKRYGAGQRAHNKSGDTNSTKYFCTVCGAEQSVNQTKKGK